MENFAGLSGQWAAEETAKIVVLPVPYDKTSSWVHGAEKGPEAFLEASVQLEWLDTETGTEVYRQGIHTAAPVTEDRTPALLCEAVEARMGELWDAGKFPCMIGGNHTVSIGACRAAAKRFQAGGDACAPGHFGGLTVLQLDAHSDLRPEYEGSELNHACIMKEAQKVAKTVQVGIRSQCIEEAENAAKSTIVWARDIWEDETFGQRPASASESWAWEKRVYDALTENVYLTIDLDVFDPAYLPSTGTPEPGGMGYYQVLHLLRPVFERYNVVGFDIVELCPSPPRQAHASQYLAARLAYQLMTYKFYLRNK